MKKKVRVILDNRTPSCLPRWARDEIVHRRLQSEDLKRRNSELRQQLAEALGEDPVTAIFSSLEEIQRPYPPPKEAT